MKRIGTILSAAVLVYAALILLWAAVSSRLDHDEHQFMTSAFLVAHEGLHPYRDFPYFHMPNLVYLYSAFFMLPHPFLVARLFAGLCGFGICLVIFVACRQLCSALGRQKMFLASTASVLLLVHSPLYRYGTSRVWNHAPASLCAVASVLLLLRAIRVGTPLWYLFSGMTLGMAIGIRLSFAFMVLPLLVAVLCTGSRLKLKARGVNAMAFALGGVITNLPSLYFLAANYQDVLFGNLEYARLNTLYRMGMEQVAPMTLLEKLDELKDSVFGKPVELAILIATTFAVLLCLVESRRVRVRPPAGMLLILVVLPFVGLGCIAPTPTWYQYYFVLMPFMILLLLFALSGLVGKASSGAAILLMCVVTVISYPYGGAARPATIARDLVSPESWPPIRIERDSVAIKAYLDSRPGNTDGAILTLSPLYAVLSGMPVYTEFGTGSFAWRVSPLVPENEAVERGLPVPSRIASLLAERPPRAVLTGQVNSLERPLIDAAERLGYEPATVVGNRVVWVRTGSGD